MNAKNISLNGKGLPQFVGRSLMMIFLLISVIGMVFSCGQVSERTAMQCFECIRDLQVIISAALQEAQKSQEGQVKLETNGKESQWILSIKDLTLLDQTFQELMKSGTLQDTSEISTMISSFPYKADDALEEQWRK